MILAERFAASRVSSLPPQSESLIVPVRGACLLAVASCSASFGQSGWAPGSRLFLERLALRAADEALADAAYGAFDDLCASDLAASQPQDDDRFDPYVMFAAALVSEDRAVLAAIGGHRARVVRDGAIVASAGRDVLELPGGALVVTRSLSRHRRDEVAALEVPLRRGDDVQVLFHGMSDVPRSDEAAEALRRELDASRVIALVAST